ncbi:MAG TPA: hypothetical protein VJV75_10195 [Candidatus Polarisedimenticolia bacterium]|nr:hypothetical protein [Candidatus Polarisedimenticolia bacterium]
MPADRPKALDLKRLKRVSIEECSRKVAADDLAQVTEPSEAMTRFLRGLPRLLAGREFLDFVDECVTRRRQGQPLLLMYGGHVVKCGLAPLVIDLLERGYVQALATNGAGAIHDVEMALFGRTSEDVAAGLADGSFGMVRETGDFFADTVRAAAGRGLGEALGERLLEAKPEAARTSLLGAAARLGLPATVHVAIGTDIVHQHPDLPAAGLGEATHHDFRLMAGVVAGMAGGGVVVNLGSAVVLPEVFLKALSVARNLGHDARDIVTANFDMLRHYRPQMNVVDRPTRHGGRGFSFTGHHEILVPLLHAALRSLAETPGDAASR